MSRILLALASRAALDPARAGGKGAGLARLVRRGLSVPPGFVVSADAFRAQRRALGLDAALRAAVGDPERVEALADRVATAPLPPDLARRVRSAARRLPGPLAVRSSLVGEDAPERSYAGQLDSFLDVAGDAALLDALRRCWASLFRARCAAYRTRRAAAGAPPPDMAVIVQQMVRAAAAGVAFSADPVSGRRCVVVEGVSGSGAKLAAGRADPFRAVVDARGVIESWQAPADTPPSLDEAAVLDLARLVRRVADAAGEPQDVEWARDGAGFHLLQARPVGGLRGRDVWSRQIVGEMAPGVIKPLLWTAHTQLKATAVLGRLFGTLLGEDPACGEGLVRLVQGRVYTNATRLGRLLERAGLPANFFENLTREERRLRRPPLRPRLLLTGLRGLGLALREGRFRVQAARVRAHDAWLERFRRTDWSALDPPAVMAAAAELRRRHGETQWTAFACAMNLVLRRRRLLRLVRRGGEAFVGPWPWEAVSGADSPTGALARVAAGVAALTPAARERLAAGDDAAVRAALAGSEAGRALAVEADRFLARHGFLSADGTDFTAPSWAEEPERLWRALHRLHAGGRDAPGGGPAASGGDRALAALERLRRRLQPHRRPVLRRALAAAGRWAALRERSSRLMSEDAQAMRGALLALAARWRDAGGLDRTDDIFFLTWDEVTGWAQGGVAPPPGTVARRRREHAAAVAGQAPPETLVGDAPPPPVPPVGSGVLVGIGGSAGVASGRARLVRDPDEVDGPLGRGDILVVPAADVGWTPLFAVVGGVVAESGGQLSHSAVIAREYGLPAVVGVREATRRILPGQRLVVDGGRGRVILDPPEPEEVGP
ncbi:MAG: hypothetical protein JW819_04170 [Candidatus Krumholzibacteriota bacterium]|nr:hypothetical protein [Candidatus Krumholzibacteriota bacterium]